MSLGLFSLLASLIQQQFKPPSDDSTRSSGHVMCCGSDFICRLLTSRLVEDSNVTQIPQQQNLQEIDRVDKTSPQVLQPGLVGINGIAFPTWNRLCTCDK